MAKEQVTTTTIDKLVPDDKNFNKGTEYGKQLLGKSFAQFGAGRSILLDKNNRIIAGNKATEEYGEQGGEKVIVVETDGKTLVAVKRTDIDLDSKRGRELALADNATQKADLEWDTEVVEAISKEWEIDAKAWGVEVPEELAQTEVKEDDFDAGADVESRCKKGDIWQLGEHRLMCGDSTKAEDVEKLMNGEKADILFTDPPYGMGLDTDFSTMEGFSKGDKYKQGKVDDFDPKMIEIIFSLNIPEVFLWSADYYAELIPNRNEGSWIMWDKRANGNGNDEEDVQSDKMYGSCFELCWSKKKHKRDIARIKWAGLFGMEQEFDNKRWHPTQKPIALSAWFLSRYSKTADIVLDLFGGSGTTLIAAEQLGRTAYLMELDPHYCDVILARWEQFTGKTAVKI